MLVFTLIGLFVVIKFGIRNRRMFMDKEAFFKAVAELREAIINNYYSIANRRLDTLVSVTIIGDKMSEDLNLQEDVARIIKRIKQAKENEALREKANELIEELKKEL